MAALPRIVIDTNVLISALLAPESTPGQAVTQAEDAGVLLASAETIAEIEEVLARPRFDRYLSTATRAEFLKRYRIAVRRVIIGSAIRACRDPRDDKFLEVAIHGQADVIISGDEDLLCLNPFRTVRIVSPRGFLEFMGEHRAD